MAGRMTSRTFFSCYSAGSQRAADDADGDGWRDRMLGTLRLDLLTCRTVVVPDTHLFDGRFFLRNDPGALSGLIARQMSPTAQLPIEVRTRAASRDLNSALADLLRRPGTPMLNSFEFNSIEDRAVRADLADRLAAEPETSLDEALAAWEGRAPQGVAALLRRLVAELGHDERPIDDLERGWAGLIEQSWRFQIEAWDSPFPLQRSLEEDRLDGDDLSSDLGARTLRELRAQIAADLAAGRGATRGAARAIIRRAEVSTSTPAELLDIEVIQDWFTRGRHRAIARQHRCNLGGDVAPTVWRSGRGRRLVERLTRRPSRTTPIEIPDDLLDRLAELAAEDYRRLCSSNRSDLVAWWDHRDHRALERLGRSLADRTQPARASTIGPLREVILPLVGAGATVGTAIALGVPPPVSATGVAPGAALAAGVRVRRRAGVHRIVEMLDSRSGTAADGPPPV